MAALQSIQVDVDIPASVRAVSLSHSARHGTDLLLKTFLTSAFAGPVIRPWMVHRHGPVATVLGYSPCQRTTFARGWHWRSQP
jgi:hypothetical protein